jgi:FkbM family methyltransferase
MPINVCQPFPPFVELADCRYGQMLYPRNDQYVGRSFKEYGQFSQGEVEIFTRLVQRGAVVLDVGANIGAHTVPLAQLAGEGGAVVAFEPQPVLHRILCANLALNSVPNAVTYAMALGSSQGTCRIPILNYAEPYNFGGVSMDMAAEGEVVPMGRLDDFQLDRVDFVKLDVEGFESQVLEGAADTIARCRPVMYIENDREEKSAALIQRLLDMGYRLWWHTPPLFSPGNFKNNPENVFSNICSLNMLAIHRDQSPVSGLKPILAAQDRCR